MRVTLMLMAMFSLAAPPAQADAALESRVLRLEAQVKALQDGLKAALQTERAYSIRAANGGPDSCLVGSPDASAGKAEVLLGKCDSGPRSWKFAPAQ